jgi:hypothetical protein
LIFSRGRSPVRLFNDLLKERRSDDDLKLACVVHERVTFYSKAGEPFHAVVHIAAHVH